MAGFTKKQIIVLIMVISMTITGCSVGVEPLEDKAEAVNDIEEGNEIDKYMIQDNGDTVTFNDGREERIEIGKNPKRVVVLFNSFVDIWVENGGEMVGMIEDPNNIIPGTEDVDTVGRFGSISLEKVISLEPDLVILSSNSKSSVDMIQPLEENNIPVIPLTYEFKEDYYKISALFAMINDRMDLYEENAGAVDDEVQEIIDMVPEQNNPSVLILFATSKSVTARGSLSTLGQMFYDLGAVNIAEKESLIESIQFSMEEVISSDPDFIMVQTMGSDINAIEERLKSEVESNPAWSELSAVKNDKYIVLPKDLYMYKANRRYGEAYKNLAQILYPETYK